MTQEKVASARGLIVKYIKIKNKKEIEEYVRFKQKP
jgi:hypothetical protein